MSDTTAGSKPAVPLTDVAPGRWTLDPAGSSVAFEHKSIWGLVNVNLRPFYAEGSKTFGYEIAEQLGWRTPQHVVSPMAGGSLIGKIHKAFHEMYKVGLLDPRSRRIESARDHSAAARQSPSAFRRPSL